MLRARGPQFVSRPAFRVMGLESRDAFANDDFDSVWQQYMAYHDAISPHSTDGAHYGVYYCEGTGEPVVYLAGMAVEDVEQAPDGVVVREVPGGRYATFGCTVATIHDTYEFIFHAWQPAPEHRIDESRPNYECYLPNCTSGESPVQIYIPVEAGP